ncbi:CGNR zinc finger domain-containing protein [Actinotalea solisilvae]|uniref:CGNR zinc finger domain-containing protein n=1 Tax=Actinotalea solisilvae TaxID=2072922 RepID=UPI0018F10C58|nr:CGNR zinc finger domain-containing protein [Actinotalea solisilvae]
MADVEPAVPRAVGLVRDFVNTYEPQVDAESVGDPAVLGRWLVERGLAAPGTALHAADVVRAHVVREGLRSVLLDHAGHEPDPAALAALNATLAASPVTLAFAPGGHRIVALDGDGLAPALAGLLDAVREAAEDQTWGRLKVCARDTCRWAFYDASRNQARRWCSMAGCGNTVKMRRAYAARTGRGRPDATDGSVA